jgi:hypothetical protein
MEQGRERRALTAGGDIGGAKIVNHRNAVALAAMAAWSTARSVAV